MAVEVDNKYLPTVLFDLINDREDLKKKGFLNINNERKLIRWIIRNGIEIYPELFEGHFKNNEIIKWLSSFCLIKEFEQTPRIFLAIWDLHPRHKKIWNNPNDKEYVLWLKLNWYGLKINLPAYNAFFKEKIVSFLYFINIFLKYKNSKLSKNLINQIRIVFALLYWEINLRIAKINLGYWSLITPRLSTLIIFLLIGYFLRGRGSGIFLFFGVGILYFQLFKEIAITINASLKDYERLSIFPQIKPIDIIITYTILENFLTLFLLILVISLDFIIKQELGLNNIALFLGSYLLLTLFSFSTGLFFRVITYTFPPFPKILIWFNRVIFITSGAIFPISRLPQTIRPFLSWNPLLQSIEISRGALDKNYFVDLNLISFKYLFFFTLYLLLFSLSLYSISEKSLIKK